MLKNQNISLPVIKRLPRYYRYLGELKRCGIIRISSRELSERMGLTASQIRQDLNCFGGFGQQGYGYTIAQLYDEIGNILHLNSELKTVLIGAGNVGRAIVNQVVADGAGFQLIGIFDRKESVVGQSIEGFPVRHIDTLDDFCRENCPDVAVICIPKEEAENVSDQLVKLKIKGFWNFSHYDVIMRHPSVIVENVHLRDSLMTLCYNVNEMKS